MAPGFLGAIGHGSRSHNARDSMSSYHRAHSASTATMTSTATATTSTVNSSHATPSPTHHATTSSQILQRSELINNLTSHPMPNVKQIRVQINSFLGMIAIRLANKSFDVVLYSIVILFYSSSVTISVSNFYYFRSNFRPL